MIIGVYSSQPQSGKSTVVEHITESLYITEVSLAEPLKAMIKELLTFYLGSKKTLEVLQDPRYKDELEVPIIGKTLRYLYQTIGTEWGRDLVNEDLLLRYILLREEEAGTIIVPDVRFQNEFNACDFNIKVKRNTNLSYDHRSEGNLDDQFFDFVINNDGTLEELYKKCDILVNRLSYLLGN